MRMRRFTRLVAGLAGITMVAGITMAVQAQDAKKIKIGVIYDYRGPFAGGGSELPALGAKIMLDYFIKKGGVEGYQLAR
jgi:branched-chain amino acid transport system substrate-binding protein